MTPMEEQYNSIKKNHQDKILLFRLGDFYEIFNEDAETASAILNIALTKRHSLTMCGFPHHAFDQYAYKLVEAGHKLAVCEQTEDPSLAKGLVRREVVSVLSKGTWAENPLLDRSANTFLCSFYYESGWLSMALCDIGTGEVIIRSSDSSPVLFLRDELSRYLPVELIAPVFFFDLYPVQEEIRFNQNSLRLKPDSYYKSPPVLDEYLKNSAYTPPSCVHKALIGLFAYLEENHLPSLQISRLLPPREYRQSGTLLMGENTLTHLEILYNNKDYGTKATLFSVINRTKTQGGARLLRRLLAAPSVNLDEIRSMQMRTAVFLERGEQALQGFLKGIGDLERLCARLASGKILPRECLALADSIRRAEQLKSFLASAPAFLPYIAPLQPCEPASALIEATLSPECSNQLDGSAIRQGISEELDRLKSLSENGKNVLISLQAEERIKTGIATLKISYNKIYGYFIEVGKASADRVPPHYIRKQSLVNSERYTIPQLEDFEKTVLGAQNTALALERELYENLVQQLLAYYAFLLPLAAFVSETDLRFSLAQYAREARCVLPELTEGFSWDISEGRHPVVEALLKKETFVANETRLDKKQRILILTGPNMAGKSTYLRQNALFAVLAQIGAPIPAKSAVMGIVDQIFTRIGAGDDLSSGRSTFYMEMEEAAQIIEKASPKSLIIMDELGRGTSTSDGLALAWAVIEHFLFHPDRRAKVLFSTHYHELTALGRFEGVLNCCMAVKESAGHPVFLRRVTEGKASKSYGIHVAELAGLDRGVVKRAGDILASIEKGTFFKNPAGIVEQPVLFPQEDTLSAQKNSIYRILEDTNPEILSPLEALRLIFELKEMQK